MPKFSTSLKVFTGVALSCGWAGMVINRVAKTEPGQEGPGLLFWLVAPLASVAIIRWRTGGWSRAGLNLNLPTGWKWYAAAIGIPPFLTAVTTSMAAATGGVTFDFDWTRYGSLVASVVVFNVVKNIFEEWSWRGYLTTELIHHRFGDWQIYTISGLIWGAWHIPYYVSLLDGEIMAEVMPINRWAFAGLAIITLTGWSVTQAELLRLSKSVWPPLLLHTVHNTLVDPLQVEGFVKMSTGKSLAFSPVIGMATTIGYVAIGLGLRHLRRKQLHESL